MPDLSITAANVEWLGGTRPRIVTFGASVTPGQAVYKDSADNEHKLGDADVVTSADIEGIALTNGYDGKEGLLALPGARINIGATTTAGVPYVASTTAGGVAPYSDLASGDFPTILFWGTGTAIVTLICEPAGVAI